MFYLSMETDSTFHLSGGISCASIVAIERLRLRSRLTGNQAQELLNAISQNIRREQRDGAVIGLLPGFELRRSEVVGMPLILFSDRQQSPPVALQPFAIWSRSCIPSWSWREHRSFCQDPSDTPLHPR